jgi:hypothetical protein
MAQETIPTYDDPVAESTLQMGVSGGPLVLLSSFATIDTTVANGFDTQRGKNKALNFARVKFLGIDLAKFDVSFTVYPDEEANFKRLILPLFRQKGKAGNAPAMQVLNPQINQIGVDKVTVMRAHIGHPMPKDGRQVRLELQEWAPAPTKPKASTAKAEEFGAEQIAANVARANAAKALAKKQ